MSENNFPRAGFFTRGYDPSQVDEFFTDARKAYEGGYPPKSFRQNKYGALTLTWCVAVIKLAL